MKHSPRKRPTDGKFYELLEMCQVMNLAISICGLGQPTRFEGLSKALGGCTYLRCDGEYHLREDVCPDKADKTARQVKHIWWRCLFQAFQWALMVTGNLSLNLCNPSHRCHPVSYLTQSKIGCEFACCASRYSVTGWGIRSVELARRSERCGGTFLSLRAYHSR